MYAISCSLHWLIETSHEWFIAGVCFWSKLDCSLHPCFIVLHYVSVNQTLISWHVIHGRQWTSTKEACNKAWLWFQAWLVISEELGMGSQICSSASGWKCSCIWGPNHTSAKPELECRFCIQDTAETSITGNLGEASTQHQEWIGENAWWTMLSWTILPSYSYVSA